MGKVKHCCWLIALLLLLTGCSRELDLYTVVEVNNNTHTVTDGELLYSYNEYGLSILKKEFQEVTPIKPLSSYGSSYTLTHKELNKYTGTLEDAVGYYNYLLSKGFITDRIEYRHDYLDAKVSDTTGEVIRVVYLGSDIVRVFYKSPSNKNIFPPYIHREE